MECFEGDNCGVGELGEDGVGVLVWRAVVCICGEGGETAEEVEAVVGLSAGVVLGDVGCFVDEEGTGGLEAFDREEVRWDDELIAWGWGREDCINTAKYAYDRVGGDAGGGEESSTSVGEEGRGDGASMEGGL